MTAIFYHEISLLSLSNENKYYNRFQYIYSNTIEKKYMLRRVITGTVNTTTKKTRKGIKN